MAEPQLWTAAFLAVIVWSAVTTFALMHSRARSSNFAKAFVWGSPALGLIAMAALLYDAFYGEADGFRSFALQFSAVLFYALIPVLVLGQIAGSAIAKALDSRDS